MLRKVEKNAKNKEEALKLASEELGVPVEELSYEVEREVGNGIMGWLLGKEVIISAWVTKEAEEEQRIKESAKERARSQEFEAKTGNPYAPKQEPQTKDYAGDKKKAPKADKPKSEPVKAEKTEKAEVTEQTAEVAEKPASQSRKKREVTEKSVEDAKYFAENLVRKMGLEDAQVTAENGGDCVSVDVAGSKMGLLIGKRGDTLDAVQYLTSLYVNKEKNSYIKVNVDTENYRAKREETLVKLAKSLERRVIRDGAAVSLEPMSPNERRIIHATLQNSNRVQTYSVGEEPHRKVVVDVK